MIRWFKILWNRWFGSYRGLDVNPVPDERNENFPLSPLIDAKLPDLQSARWDCNVRLDQGPEGMCVAFGIMHWKATIPNRVAGESVPTYSEAKRLYKRIQKNDRWPGEDYSGTSLEDGLKLLKKEGLVQEFRWTKIIPEILKCISKLGPLIFVIPTYEGFYYPSKFTGEIKPQGKMVGWHCILCNEYDAEKDRIWFVNSWGKRYGKDGRCWMSPGTLDKCLKKGARASFVIRNNK